MQFWTISWRSFSLPNRIPVLGYQMSVGFSIHGQEFDEYGAAENVNDAQPARTRVYARIKTLSGTKAEERRARAREVERIWREGRAEKKEDRTGREGERTTMEDRAEEDEGEG